MEINHIHGETKGVFIAVENGKEAGRMTYSRAGKDKFIIDHTGVNPDFRGKNVGKQMVVAALNFARESELKIIPLCPFAKSVLNKMNDVDDVLIK